LFSMLRLSSTSTLSLHDALPILNSDRSLLVFRFSAMGDVAMSASILKEFCQQHPDTKVIIVSRGSFKPFFDPIQEVTFHTLHSRSEEHTSDLQSRENLVCRLLLE